MPVDCCLSSSPPLFSLSRKNTPTSSKWRVFNILSFGNWFDWKLKNENFVIYICVDHQKKNIGYELKKINTQGVLGECWLLRNCLGQKCACTSFHAVTAILLPSYINTSFMSCQPALALVISILLIWIVYRISWMGAENCPRPKSCHSNNLFALLACSETQIIVRW